MLGGDKEQALRRLTAAILIAGTLVAISLLPLVVAGAAVVNTSAQTMNSNLDDITSNSSLPRTTTVTDRDGQPIAWIYDQRRTPVTPDLISDQMKKSIVAIEDRRFYEHKGVDVRGSVRALVANLSSGGVEEGASTIDQQYVKNYLYLISADTEQEQAAAIETSIPRKLREMKMASELDRTFGKDEILARYLNLISFGHGAFGIEEASQTYFGISAVDLNSSQAALLAGVVQSTSALDPWANPTGATERRNQVLQARVTAGTLTQPEADQLAKEPLGILDKPGGHPNGCIGAGGAGFFCDYALGWLKDQGFDQEKISRGGYTIKTTLDREAQRRAEAEAAAKVSPTQPGVAQATNFITPAKDSHEVVAMASSRAYGLDTNQQQTVMPLTHSLQGHGAGSIFKVFTAAAALEQGMGLDSMLAVPKRVEIEGMGDGGAPNCPAGKYCVENSGPYAGAMSLRQALATSPNTPFVNMLKETGVNRPVDIAVNLGLRSYKAPKTFNDQYSIADYVKTTKLGSFTLGPTAVDPLELANVAASLADHGRWCEPNPVLSVTGPEGNEEKIKRKPCEQVLAKPVADALANGLAGDATGTGTAAGAAGAEGWNGPISAKTGTTETSFSSAFMGFTPRWAGATYIFNDGGTPSPLCSRPVRQCGNGDLFGGEEPARTFFAVSRDMAGKYGGGGLPPVDPKYLKGNGRFDNIGPPRDRRDLFGTPLPLPGFGPRTGDQAPNLQDLANNVEDLVNQFLHR
ncbi:transglycosylase domain-containing protein [Corynebacterium heidelbergense]|uniref:transglycosylase domain-containing protein n=1 Tax=Corynebacterium heidelbergense TaxID=2055947 RepID=UPI003F68B2A8